MGSLCSSPEEDYESEFYNLIEQLHSNMSDFKISDEQKLTLIEYISILIADNNSFKIKIEHLNSFADKLLNIL